MNKKLHILFLNSWYPSRVLPINGDFIQRHAEAVSLKHQVTSIHIITDPNSKQSIEIVKKEINGINTIIGYLKQTQNPILKGYLFFRAYKNILREIGHIDLVHLNVLYPFGIFALHLKWFRKKPFIISEHWTGYHFPLSKKIEFFQKYISKVITKNAKYICPVSNDLGSSMQKFGLKGNYQRVPNVVNTDLFIPSKKKSLGFKILHISNMNDAHKNIFGILKAISQLYHIVSNFEVFFIGSNSSQYRSMVSQLNINPKIITFIDRIEQKELVNYFHKSDVFVLFSNYENLPCVILESFSAGTPVITTNVGGIEEYFPTDFGYLIEKKNEKELLDKLIEIYNNPISNAEKMHRYAVANFSKKTIAKDFSNLYYQSLN